MEFHVDTYVCVWRPWRCLQEVAKVVEGMQARAAALQSTHEVPPSWFPTSCLRASLAH